MHAFVKSANPWLDPLIEDCIRKCVPDVIFHDDFESMPVDAKEVVQITNGWHLNRHFGAMNNAEKGLLNAYPSSDGLSRKDYLASVVEYWVTKRPDSLLNRSVPRTVRLTLDYSEFVDESLAAADDLTLLRSLEDNEEREPATREWWILKPALIDCGAGIRIFSTVEELSDCLELADGEDEEGEECEPPASPVDDKSGFRLSPNLLGLDALDGIITTVGQMSISPPSKAQPWLFDETQRIPSSHMREFVAQEYIVDIPPVEGRKWHVRAYVLSLGRLKVYVYRDLLALLALDKYQPPWEKPGLRSSLTNTALQEEADVAAMASMRDFWALPDSLLHLEGEEDEGERGGWKSSVFDQICDISGELIQAAAHTVADKFTALDGCFELFAVDFLVDSRAGVWLLEVNETPAFYEHGVAGPLSRSVMASVMALAMEHIGYGEPDEAARENLVQVLDETEKLGKSNISSIVPDR